VELWVDNLIYAIWNSSVPQGETPVHLSLAWQQPSQGSHTLYVIATDSVGQSTQTPSITVNITAPPQPTPTTIPGPRLTVNPVISPTDLSYQTITGQTDPNVNVTIVGEAGRFYERSNAEGTFAITINLASQRVNHLIVSAAYDNPAAAVTETQTDVNGNPLAITQVPSPTPMPVPPTPTPAFTLIPPTPTFTPVPPVTLADNGRTITLHVGQRFLLDLGADYNWTVTVDHPLILSRVVNVLVIRGAQGLYEAHSPGYATLTATGDPVCHSAQPPCEIPPREFQIHIVVE
jgi:hypothetical protein